MDDNAAVAKLKATPERHVMLYFGDQRTEGLVATP
jgi:hypothetical protein